MKVLALFLTLSLSICQSKSTSTPRLSQTRPRDSDERNAQNMGLFMEGFIFGFLGEDASEMKNCAFDAQNITTEFWDAMDNFRSATPFNLI